MDIQLPDYFKDLKELGGQLRIDVAAALYGAADSAFRIGTFVPYTDREFNYCRYLFEETLYNRASKTGYTLEPGNPFISRGATLEYRLLDVPAAIRKLLTSLHINDPELLFYLHQSALMGAYYQSEFVRWRKAYLQQIQEPTQENGGVRQWRIFSDEPGEHQYFYSRDGSPIRTKSEFSIQERNISGTNYTFTAVIACIRIKTF